MTSARAEPPRCECERGATGWEPAERAKHHERGGNQQRATHAELYRAS
jgi:hypothetical protein